MSGKAAVTMFALAMLAGFPGEAADVKDAPLRPSLQGNWVAFAVPAAWPREYTPEAAVSGIYVLLDAPSADDLVANYYPCNPPTRIEIVAGVNDRPRRKTVFQVDFCDHEWKPPASLSWARGPKARVDGLGVTLRTDGALVLSLRVSASDGGPNQAGQTGAIEHVVARSVIQSIVRDKPAKPSE